MSNNRDKNMGFSPACVEKNVLSLGRSSLKLKYLVQEHVIYTVSEKECTLFFNFFPGSQCIESGENWPEHY